MTKMRAVQVSRPGGPFEIVEREIPEPGPGSLRIKVQACGICHSDSYTKRGLFPGIVYPRVPGHEVVGLLDACVGLSGSGFTPAGSSTARVFSVVAGCPYRTQSHRPPG
jgi:D-arabinose 1-dehydrogenase-like Zn-dependent alcohol dehydrogenase